MMQHEELRELLEAYSLGALDTKEQGEVESHLAGCQECQLVLQEYQEVVGLLPHALAAASPFVLDPRAKERLFQAIRGGESAPSPVPLPRTTRRPWAYRPRPGWSWLLHPRLATLSMAGVLIALAVSFVWGLQLTTALARERTLRSELAALVGQQEVVLEVVDSNQAVKRLLRATEPGSSSYGKLYSRPDLPHVVAMVGRLAQSPAGQAYHLWIVENGTTFLAGVLTPNTDGFALLVLDAGHNGPVYEAAWVTLQPPNTPVPSESTVLRWPLSK